MSFPPLLTYQLLPDNGSVLPELDLRLGIILRVVIRGIHMMSPQAPTDILKVFVLRRNDFGEPFCAFAHAVMRGKSAWSVGERELLGALVSNLNHCVF